MPKLKCLALAAALTVGSLPASQTGTAPRRARARRAARAATADWALAAAAKQFVATGCADSLWEHVYHLQRLAVVEKCIAVTGITTT